jgi:hypothetical protein
VASWVTGHANSKIIAKEIANEPHQIDGIWKSIFVWLPILADRWIYLK